MNISNSYCDLSFFRGTAKTFCVKKIKEKCVTFCFILNQGRLTSLIKLNAKVCQKSSGEGYLFCGEVSSLLSKIIFIHIVSY